MKIAVVGSGITGLSCAWFLKERHDVTLFEKQNRFGGHANTSTINYNGTQIDVDTGFIVFNYKTYYHLQRLFAKLGVEVGESKMSFGVSNEDIEYSSVAPFANGNLLKSQYLKMLFEIAKFNKIAKKDAISPQITLENYLNQYNFSQYFCQNYIYAMAGAIWSCSIEKTKEYPAKSFIDFFKHHGLLQMFNHPQWYYVKGGSKEYVKKIINGLNVKQDSVKQILKDGSKVKIISQNGEEIFDKVIIATHANEAFEITGNEMLEGFKYSKNLAVLHKDSSFMPKNQKTWASWNYVSNSNQNLCLTYWMNNLQNIDKNFPLFVTLNPTREIKKEDIFYETVYHHPIFDFNAHKITQSLQKIQGNDGIYYAGSYFGYGFHEDGIASAYNVCKMLLNEMPW